jgi:hypothetical protein
MSHTFFSTLGTRSAPRLSLAALTLFASLSAQAQQAGPSQDVYSGIGALSIATIGYARPINSNFGLRVEYGGWAAITRDDKTGGANATATLKLNHGGLFADWFPFQNGFRLVGGVTFNDIGLDLTSKLTDGDTLSIGDKTDIKVTPNDSYGVKLTFPTTTPYIGIGYGHQQSKGKGIGFYADVGLMVGTFTSQINTTLLAKGLVTQVDIDKENQTLRDSMSGIGAVPSISLGLVYRY